MSTLSATLDRWRRPLLVAIVAIAVGYPALRWYQSVRDAFLTEGLYLGLMVVVLGSLVLAMLGSRDDKPPMLTAHPEVPAFETLPDVNDLGTAVFLLFATGGQLGSLVHGQRRLDGAVVAAVLTSLFAGLALLQVAAAWQGTGVRLRPDGLSWRTPLRSIRIPWAALALDGPPRPGLAATHLTLAYARPELVRRRGLRPRIDRFPIGRVHPWFLADVIRHYVAHPEDRPAIGTADECRRLLGVLGLDPAVEPR